MNSILLKDGRYINFDQTKIMGIINLTPDSYYEPSRCDITKAYDKAMFMIESGIDIIDVGGESTRPRSKRISVEEEIDRVISFIEKIRDESDIIISMDTYNSKTAYEGIKRGVDIINDISGMTFDENMVNIISDSKVPIVIMHCPKNPEIMQIDVHYDDVIQEICIFFEERISYLEKYGIQKNKIILDPGISFGKLVEHNLELIKGIDVFQEYNCPLLYGVSRKGFLSKLVGDNIDVHNLYATLAVNAYLMTKKVDIIRVHDIDEHIVLKKVLSKLV